MFFENHANQSGVGSYIRRTNGKPSPVSLTLFPSDPSAGSLISMRLLLTVCFLIALLDVGAAQQNSQNLFQTVKPEATIRVQKHPTGADMVEITLLDSQYPPDVLRNQIRRLGVDLGSDPRGVTLSRQTFSRGPGGQFLRADFAVDRLTDPANGIYRLGPLARAMVGAPKGHEIHGLMVIFEQQAPTSSTLQNYGLRPGAPVSVMGGYEPGQIGLEYRIALNTQDPSKIDIPDHAGAETPLPRVLPPQIPSTPWSLYGSAALFALATGALVYSLTLRNSGPRPPSASKNQFTGTSRHR
jgi:hypothetical protein